MRERKTGKSKDFPIGKNAKKAIQEYVTTIEADMDLPLFRSRRRNSA